MMFTSLALGALLSSADPMAVIRSFKGSWVGVSEGASGKAKVTKKFELVFGGKYVRFETLAQFPPKNGKPGEVHRDTGFFSYDSQAKGLALREFHVEGFVNTYKQERTTGGSLVFVTRDIENNIAPGWRARVTLKLVSPNQLIEEFALAEPGKEFTPYGTSRFRRK